MRTPIQILDQVISTLPPKVFAKYYPKLESIRESLGYAPPEGNIHVERFVELFNEIVGPPPFDQESEAWKVKAVSAYMGEPEEQTRKKLGIE